MALVKLKYIPCFVLLSCCVLTICDSAYLGCFKENRRRPVFNRNPGAIQKGTLTPDKCISTCGAFQFSFAGLRAGEFCFCNNGGSGSLPLDSDGNCSTPCVGNLALTCGSITHVQVYDATSPIEITVDASPKVVATGDTVVVTTNVQTNNVNYNVRVDYGDDAGVTDYIGFPSSHNFSRTYHMAGEYSVMAYANSEDLSLIDAETATSVVVKAPVRGVTVNCPEYMATYTPDTCSIDVNRGTDLNITITYDDGILHTSNFPIADAVEYFMGNPVQEMLMTPELSMTVSGSTVVHQAYPAEYSGTLVGLEYFANISGTLEVSVYRPMCPGEYCYDSNTCVALGACNPSCSTNLYCSDIDACCTGSTTRTPGIIAGVTYSGVYSTSVSVTPGYGYVDVVDNFQVLPGDLVTHTANPPLLAKTTVAGSAADWYCTPVYPSDFTLTDCTSTTTESIQLKAIYSQTSKILLPLEFTAPGNITVEATAAQRNGAVATATNDSVIVVVEGVDMAMFVEMSCIPANEPTLIQVYPYTGVPSTLFWDFGNGDKNITYSTTDVLYTYTSTGNFNLTVNITNAMSFKSNVTTVCVQERITGLSLSTVGSPVEVGVNTSVAVTMATGSDYTCEFRYTYPDSSVVTETCTEINCPAYSYIFNIAGNMVVYVNCSNSLSWMDGSVSVVAMERITGAALTPPGATANVPFNIVLSWTTGTDVSVQLWYDSVVEVMTIDSPNRQAVSSSKTEAVTGLHNVTYILSNAFDPSPAPVNTIFAIEVAITNPVIDCVFLSVSKYVGTNNNQAVIPANSDVSCTVDMDAGTSVVIDFLYNDGGPDDQFSAGVGVAWSANTITFPVIHTFTNTGFFPFQVKVSNGFNSFTEDFPVWVMVSVDGVQLNPQAPETFYPPASVTFDFTYTAPPPNDVTCYIEWGDGNDDEYYPCDITSTYTHEYMDKDGNLPLYYRLTNHVSQKKGNFTVYIVTPIIGYECFTVPTAAAVGEPVEFVFKTWRGPGAGLLDLTFDCDTSVAGNDGTREREYNSPDGEDVHNCTFSTKGTYTMSVIATSQIESQTCTHSVEVIYPVTEEYTFAALNAPIDYDATGNCMVNYMLNYHGTPLPDAAYMVFDYGDGTVTSPIAFNPTYSHSYTYSTHGHYITTITLFNDASTSTTEIASGCYANFLDTTIVILREPFIPVGSPDLPGYGVAEDKFRSDELLKIHASHNTGTFVYWEVTAVSDTDIHTCNSTNSSVIDLAITNVGNYTITVTAKNPLFSGPPTQQVVEVMKPVNGTVITDDGNVTGAYEFKDFRISMTSYGTSMCIAVNFNDGPFVQTYGDSVTCDITSVPDGMFAGKTVQYNGGKDVSKEFMVRHQYTAQGTYLVQAYSWNEFSTDYAEFQFAVSGIDCSAPNIGIKDRHVNFRYPLEFPRSKRIKIIGVTDIACPETLKNTKIWTAVLWNGTMNERIASVSLANVTSAVNSELALDPGLLPYGQYLLKYKVTMLTPDAQTGAKFSSYADTFIKVVKSKLVVQIFNNSMSRISVGPAKVITLSPVLFSYDPDVNKAAGETDVFDSFAIACRDMTLNETFPNSSVTVTAMNLTDLPPLHVNIGGCFQTGPGWVNGFGGSLTFRTDILTVGHTYEFKVIGYKDDRSSFALGQVEVKSGSPPEFRIDFKIPGLYFQGPAGKMFNPNTQLGFVGTVLDTCTSCTFSFFWEMFAFDYQYCGEKFNCWRNLAYLSRYIEGTNSEELTVHTEVFSHYYEIDTFQVRLHVTNVQTGVTGSASMNLTRNHPPSGGNCTIFPLAGISASTNFTIDCATHPFTDVDGDTIADHVVTCKLTDRTVLVASGYNYWAGKFLPVGDINNGNTLKCNVTVTDEHGARAVYPINDVQVDPMPIADFRNILIGLTTTTDDLADIIDAIANLDETSSYANAMQDMLHVMSQNDEFADFANMGTALSFTSTNLDTNVSRPGAFEQLVDDPDQMEYYENVRDAGAQLVNGLVSTLTKCTVESPEETSRMADTVSALSSSPAFLTRETQASMTGLLELGVQNMYNNIASLSVEDIKAIGQSTLDACSNIERAATLAMDHPTNTDIDTQNEAVPYFSSNMDTSVDDVPVYASDADAVKAGKKILNKDEQSSFAVSNLGKCQAIQDDIVFILASQKPKSNEPTVLKTGSMETAVIKNDVSGIQNQTLSAGGCGVSLPADMFSASSSETLIMTLSAKTSPSAPVEDNSPVSKYSRELSVGFKYPNGTDRRIYNLATPIELGIRQDPNQPRFNRSLLGLANPKIVPTREEEYLFYHQVIVSNKRSAIQLKFSPTNVSSENQLLVLVNYKDMPEITSDGSKVKEVCMIPSLTSKTGLTGDDIEPDPYQCFVDGDIVGDNVGEWKIGVRQLLPSELDLYTSIATLPSQVPDEWKANKEFNQDYVLYPVELSCAYSEPGSSIRQTDGVKPTHMSSEDEIKCLTTHLTTFAGGWVVAPNTIDWNFVFSNADFFKNPTLYITEIVIVILYIIAMIWARRKDRQDVEQLGLAPLLDNDPRDKYYYEILVSTGLRRGAGTESKVHFILSGEEEETDVRTFTDKKRKIFQRGCTNGFLMAVTDPLGPLTYLRIWHDNSGKGALASWYLNHVLVRDVQTDKKYYFIANRWFAVEEDDGQVDRVIPVAGKAQMTEFTHLFQDRASKNLTDGHLWFSVVARPPSSRFTRCQRVSCCLCLLFTSMLANAMFYNTATSDTNAFQFGPFAITSEQIFIGVAANLIIFPVNFLLVLIFRKSRPRKLRPSRVEEALRSMPERSTSTTDVNMRVKSSMEQDRPGSSFLMDVKRSQSSMSRPESSLATADAKNKKKKCELPWWFVVIGWILLFLTVLVSAAFVTFYGIMFQDIKCKKWITSMLISFFTSVFFTQPIKVFLFAIIFSLIIKNPGGDEEESTDDEEQPKNLKEDEEYLHEEEDDEFGIASPRKPLYKPKPPDSKSLKLAREQRLKEIQMWAIIREILFYAFFLWILLVISYRSVSVDSYRYKDNMKNVFILTNDTRKAFTKVQNTEDFWEWAKSGMLRGLRAGPYYNNFPPFYMRGYINDKQSRLMGYAVLRQLRIDPNSCKIPSVMEDVIHECNSPYELSLEQTDNFGPSWTSRVNFSREEYIHQSASSLSGYPYLGDMALYSGGGYIVRLNKDYFDMIDQFNQLQNESWIDRYTRAVFLEFTVYNPSINLFAVSTLLAEFRPSGGVFTSHRFEPCNLLPYMTSALLFQIVCEVIYLLFTLFFIIKLIRSLVKEKCEFFKQFWNLMDLGICAMSVTAVVIYFYRLVCINELTEYFKETHGNEYIKFQYVGYWSELFNYIIGFLVYFATLKFLKLLRFNRKISMLADTLSNSSKDLFHFSIIFNIVFLAFIQLFYLIFSKHLDIFKTFTSSCEAGFVMMMGKFDIYNMLGVNQWLTQIFLFLFVVTVTFIIVNMLISILNDTFSAVRNDKSKQTNDYEIVDFMLGRFKMWTGLGRGGTTISPADLEKERNQNYRNLETQIDHFPDQIDRFLMSVSKMYMGDAKFDNFLEKGMAKKMADKAAVQGEDRHPAPRLPGSQRISNGARGMTDVQTD